MDNTRETKTFYSAATYTYVTQTTVNGKITRQTERPATLAEQERERNAAAIRELMTAYNDARKKWFEQFGTVTGFDDWFTTQIKGP